MLVKLHIKEYPDHTITAASEPYPRLPDNNTVKADKLFYTSCHKGTSTITCRLSRFEINPPISKILSPKMRGRFERVICFSRSLA